MNSWGNLGGAISPMVIGYVLQWTGNNWNLTFYIAAAVYAGGFYAGCFWIRRRRLRGRCDAPLI